MKLTFAVALAFVVALQPLTAFADWEIEPSHTNIGFHVSHLGLTKTPGVFRKFEGKIALNDDKIEASSVSFTIDAASIDTTSTERDTALRGKDWLDAKRNPHITFVSKSVRRIDDKHFIVSGDLTIRGKTLPVDFSATLTNRTINPFLQVPAIGFVANAQVKRTAFGMSKFLPAVGDDVELEIQTELNQKP
ncbi:MAG TPA: YceI family protein [Steroidobacteraceae bacterium]|nr:YceI family protein [Steroidobacteraceae bacterium]